MIVRSGEGPHAVLEDGECSCVGRGRLDSIMLTLFSCAIQLVAPSQLYSTASQPHAAGSPPLKVNAL